MKKILIFVVLSLTITGCWTTKNTVNDEDYYINENTNNVMSIQFNDPNEHYWGEYLHTTTNRVNSVN